VEKRGSGAGGDQTHPLKNKNRSDPPPVPGLELPKGSVCGGSPPHPFFPVSVQKKTHL